MHSSNWIALFDFRSPPSAPKMRLSKIERFCVIGLLALALISIENHLIGHVEAGCFDCFRLSRANRMSSPTRPQPAAANGGPPAEERREEPAPVETRQQYSTVSTGSMSPNIRDAARNAAIRARQKTEDASRDAKDRAAMVATRLAIWRGAIWQNDNNKTVTDQLAAGAGPSTSQAHSAGKSGAIDTPGLNSDRLTSFDSDSDATTYYTARADSFSSSGGSSSGSFGRAAPDQWEERLSSRPVEPRPI